MDKNPFLDRLMKETKEDVVHSSAYAKAQNEQGIGAASTEGFSERMAVDRQRTFVKRYGDSRVVNSNYGNVSRAKTYEPPKETGTSFRAGLGMQPGVTQSGAKTVQPPARRNPGISR